MEKRPLTVVMLLVIVIGIAIPISLSIYFANKEALEYEKARAHSYAQDVVTKSDSVTAQIEASLQRLEALHAGDPCAERSRALMRELDLTSRYIQAIGYVSNNRMICWSMDEEKAGFELGPIEMVRPRGATLRLNVELPFAPGTKFLVMEHGGYAVILHRDLLMDLTMNERDVVLATLLLPEQHVLLSQGSVKQKWLEAAHQGDATFVDEDYVVAIVRSKKYFIGAICALPISALNKRVYAISMVMIPAGILASLLISWAIVYLAKTRMAMPTVIKTALKRKEFFVEYQPVVDLRSGKWVGAEALIRWSRAEGETVSPELFIPIAEESNLIRQISRYMVDHIASEAGGLFRRYPDFHLSINLAAADFYEESTLAMLRELAAATGAQRKNIIVEATERNFTDHNLALDLIRRLRAEGFPVAIDDFGTGYSSLSYLERIELDYLKIDKSFVDTLGTEAATSGVILHIIEMAKSLQLEMIAEGVETEAQATFLRERGVQYGQGWLFGKPMSMRELIGGMKAHHRLAE